MSESPFGLDAWVDYLQDKPLPVMAHSRQMLSKRLSIPNVALMDLSPALQADPVLSLHILRRANLLNRNQDTDIRTLDHALSSLGLVKIRELIDEVPVLQMNTKSVAHRQYLYSIANSIHAAIQVRDWVMQARPAQVGHLYAGALLYGFIYWSLWRFAPHAASAIYDLIYTRHLDQVQAEIEVLGCPAQELAHALAVKWQLPEIVVSALNHDINPDKRVLVMLGKKARGDELTLDQERAINHVLHAPWMPIKLANWLTHSIHFGWYSRQARRITLLVADFLRLNRDQACARIHRNAVYAARQYSTPGIIPPAARLLMAPDDHPLDYHMPTDKVVTRNGTSNDTKDDAILPGKLLDEAYFQQQLYQLNNADKHAGSLGELIQTLNHGLHKGVGLPRCLILMANQQGSQLQSRFSAGSDLPAEWHDYAVSLDNPSIFQKLCDQPGALWVTRRNRAKVDPLLPLDFKGICHQEEFFLMSLFLGKKPIAVIYADAGAQGEVRPLHYNAYRQLIQAAGRGLSRYYRARQQTRS
ncbi:HDOD domain-containing protein [Pokkaliibacter sp. CJK22405]|uniref:HDOD domain-containing protein n=1 Tax=Pokkaliibacter sp. CJK22405 TaxID=3384615 RepID=UPI00398490C5